MELVGKKVVIPVEDMFNTHEFWYPLLSAQGGRMRGRRYGFR